MDDGPLEKIADRWIGFVCPVASYGKGATIAMAQNELILAAKAASFQELEALSTVRMEGMGDLYQGGICGVRQCSMRAAWAGLDAQGSS